MGGCLLYVVLDVLDKQLSGENLEFMLLRLVCVRIEIHCTTLLDSLKCRNQCKCDLCDF